MPETICDFCGETTDDAYMCEMCRCMFCVECGDSYGTLCHECALAESEDSEPPASTGEEA